MSANESSAPAKKFLHPPKSYILGAYLVLIGFLLIQNTVATWPPNTIKTKQDENIAQVQKVKIQEVQYQYFFWSSNKKPITDESRLFVIVLLFGALGSWLHAISSYVAFIGNREFVSSWLPWYVIRPMIGSGLALIFYMAIRAGFLTTSGDAVSISPYSVAAFAALVGLFTERASQKLAEIFDVVFSTAKESKDSLGKQVSINNVTPNTLLVNAPTTTITIEGGNFTQNSKALIAEKQFDTKFINATKLTFALPAELLIKKGELKISVLNPGNEKSNEVNIAVKENNQPGNPQPTPPPSKPAPLIIMLSPQQTKVGSPDVMVKINGSDFTKDSDVIINGKKATSSFINELEIQTTIQASLLKNIGKLEIIIKDASNGKQSNPVEFEIVK